MCTVTVFFNKNNDFVLTSNRDEAPDRRSLPPKLYQENNVEMLFPKDELAGGTWIGVSEKNRLLCLLNGGFTKHKRKRNYKFSRGIIVKNLLATNNLINSIQKYDFSNVEPFTIIILDWNIDLQFLEIVWDGEHSHFKELPLKTKIWSSSTLYTEKMKIERHRWFSDFIEEHNLNANSVLDFHKTETNNIEYGIVMDRGFVKTTSITQVQKSKNTLQMQYFDLIKNKEYSFNFNSTSAIHE